MTNAASRIDTLPPPVVTREPGAPRRGPRALPPLRLGTVALDFPVVQAALSGYSDGPMRRIARRLGAPYTLAEVVIDRVVLATRGAQAGRRFAIAPEEHPVGGQLMGSDPADFAQAARALAAAGFDVIDINFGCPVRSATAGCRGGYHLGQPAVALEIVARVRDAVPAAIPVTVKMRRGLDDSDASRERFFAILDGAFELGAAAITVHARTVEQKYLGPSNWDFLRDVKRHAGPRTILGSGDLFTAQACLDMLELTGVDGVSVARGAIGNPWIFAQARALAAGTPPSQPDLAEQRRVLELQHALSEELAGPVAALATMRLFALKFARLHERHAEVRNAFAAARSLQDWRAVLDRWYGPAHGPALPAAPHAP